MEGKDERAKIASLLAKMESVTGRNGTNSALRAELTSAGNPAVVRAGRKITRIQKRKIVSVMRVPTRGHSTIAFDAPRQEGSRISRPPKTSHGIGGSTIFPKA